MQASFAKAYLGGVWVLAMWGCGQPRVISALNADDIHAGIELTIQESKLLFTSRVVSFDVKVPNLASSLPCRDRDFVRLNGEGREHAFSTCRDRSHEVVLWHGKTRNTELAVSDELLDEDYDPKKIPTLMRAVSLGRRTKQYFACTTRQKVLISESDSSKTFRIQMDCAAVAAEEIERSLDLVTFLDNPGDFAAVMAYEKTYLPATEANAANFSMITAALLKEVPAGAYSGVMRTLSNKCELIVEATPNARNPRTLTIRHTTLSSSRQREVKFAAQDVLGFATGKFISEDGKPGTFAAAEFADGKKSLFVRFERINSQDGSIVRIDGPVTYCRRLTKGHLDN